MLANLDLSTSLLYCLITFLTLYLITNSKSILKGLFPSKESKLPRSFPIVGSHLALIKNIHHFSDWSANILNSQPSSTFILHRALGQRRRVITSNPANVQHILKTNFHVYQKGPSVTALAYDFLGRGIFNVDGDAWKFQRQIASHEFNTKSLRKFVETVVDTELSDRLVPLLNNAAAKQVALDFQDILLRFAFDNVCNIAFGYDPEYLLPSLPAAKFAVAFENTTTLITKRFRQISLVWKLQKFFNTGFEKELKKSIQEVREFATKVMREKKEKLQENPELRTSDLLSRFLSCGHSDEVFVIDVVISFILAGRDTTSAALTWFFYLIACHPNVESEILAEINDKKFENNSESSVYNEVKDMIYTHAALCESMRLYPPVPTDGKQVMENDVLPDGTHVYKNDRVIYHPYAMGRSEKLWGSDWPEFRPERWLQKDSVTGKWCFIGRDQYTYPVFQAGPRVCIGKEMAFLQMKRVVAGVLSAFRVIPIIEKGTEPVYTAYLTAKMHGGFPVRIQQRA